jgi:hypothetical protein
MNVEGISERLCAELQKVEDAIRTLDQFQPFNTAAKVRVQSLTKIRAAAKPSDAS